MNYEEWADQYPDAAAALGSVQATESENQQKARLLLAERGELIWRNNVGATPAIKTVQCPWCHRSHVVRQRPVRYGLCNDSARLNATFKSADLLGITPVLITQEHVGQTLGLFRSVEVKRSGWRFKPLA